MSQIRTGKIKKSDFKIKKKSQVLTAESFRTLVVTQIINAADTDTESLSPLRTHRSHSWGPPLLASELMIIHKISLNYRVTFVAGDERRKGGSKEEEGTCKVK